MNKSEFRHRMNSRWIGFDPDRMKTVHIANGLFLQVMGRQFTAEDINRIAVPAGKKGPIKAHASPLLLEELTGIRTGDEDTFNLFRQHVREHLGADDAIFDRQVSAGCAYSAVNARLVTDDRHNDGWAGNLIGILLATDFGNGPSVALQKLESALTDESDPLSMLLGPFLDNPAEGVDFIDTYGSRDEQHFVDLICALPDFAVWREALDTFALYYPQYLGKQRFTRLLIILSSVILMRYLVGLARASSVSINNSPFFVDALQKTSSRVRFASQLSYIRSLTAVDELYVGFVGKEIWEEAQIISGSNEPDLTAVQNACEMLVAEIEELADPNQVNVARSIRTREELIENVSRQIAGRFFNLYPNHFLQDFLRDVGIRCGTLMPRGPYPRKHFFLQPDTVEALALACIYPDDPPITMGEFVELLWARFGILVGGQTSDMRWLAEAAIRDVNQDDLDQNYAAFTAMMVTFGLAQQRSDGLVLVHPLRK